jgi:hypothetical protein
MSIRKLDPQTHRFSSEFKAQRRLQRRKSAATRTQQVRIKTVKMQIDKKTWQKLSRTTRRRIWLEREAHRLLLKRKRKKSDYRKKSLRKHFLDADPPLTEAARRLRYLRREFKSKSQLKYAKKSRSYVVTMPETFSFIHNPEAAMECIQSLLAVPPKSQTTPRAKFIHIDQKNCKKTGLAATAVFDVCAMLIKDEQKAHGSKAYTFAGTFPDNLRVRNQVKVMGITKHLQVRGFNAPKEFEDNVVHLPLQRGRRRNDDWNGKNDQELVSSRLATHLNSCFETASKYSLTEKAMAQIVKWAGEIITNAEEHSGVPDWYAMACMLPAKSANDPKSIIGECELVIFGFGKSIYQTLSATTTDTDLRSRIEALVAEHMQSGFFLQKNYSPEDLWTLYALQEGVTSRVRNSERGDGGTGTVRLIEAFQTLGKTVDDDKKPQMLILSGSTSIKFDGRYKMEEQHVDGGRRNIIAFNSQNSLRERPDPSCVSSIDGFFPGTLLSFKFYVDQRFLETLAQ